ncbi:AraC family transcriptional regulator [Brevibacillus choshinensis]|uniref:AraC family transcriptional regulator n=1 Tax=Brevibacillus choshinensis TaxID=54911 RepID=A0ABX7FUR7_BRECH|nr:helix-turn-helix domain-containing protein [Brevibacillus choshinensis]QRG69096.1 AraC family transcriptional regulator [Brevibacillus choshinensis]
MTRLYRPLQPPVIQQGLLHDHYHYREYEPSKGLEPYVACYWTSDFMPTGHAQRHRIIPDGCIDIIVDRKAASFSKGAFISELMTSYEVLDLSRPQSLFGIRFFAETAYLFLQNPVSAFVGSPPLLADLWGSQAELLVEEMMEASGIREMIEIVERELLGYLLRRSSHSQGVLQMSVAYLYAAQGSLSVRALAETICYSERNLRRLFQHELGVSPKELSQVIRFQALLHSLYHSPPDRLTQLAHAYGFFDQPHFVKNFKRYYGLLPSQVFGTKLPVSVES